MEGEKGNKVLIITYYWPPSGGAGVQRWLKFAKYLPEFGWDPVVFTPESPDFDLKDASLLKDVDPNIEVLKFPIWEPYGIFKKISGNKSLKQGQILESEKRNWLKKLSIWIRGNLFIPDPKIFWVKPSSEYILSILESNNIKHVITTGPPHSVHLIGKKLKLKNPSLTWVADFRDPWSEWDILKKMKIMPVVWKRHLKLEQEVLKMADSVLATGPTAAEEFRKLGARRVKYITNGFDKDDLPVSEKVNQSAKFIISHLGMLNSHRNPVELWNVLDELCADAFFYESLELKLVGILSPEVIASIKKLPLLSKKLMTKDSVSHSEVFNEYNRSNVLILAQTRADGAVSQLPGKLFEYLSVKRPILAIGQRDNDIAQILESTKSGQSFDYKDNSEIKNFVNKEFLTWKNNETVWKFEGIDKFERKNLTRDLAEWLEKV